VRILELQAIENKLRAGRKKRTSPKAIAEEIWDMLVAESQAPTRKIPDDFVPAGAACDTITLTGDGKQQTFRELAEERTNDEELVKKIEKHLWRMLLGNTR